MRHFIRQELPILLFVGLLGALLVTLLTVFIMYATAPAYVLAGLFAAGLFLHASSH